MIVVGASLGGSVALREILQRLPADFPLPIAVVLHRHRESEALLVSVMQRGCALPVGEADDKEPIEGGRVYIAPADYHLLIDNGSFALSTDELVNFARPSVDVLFESAADWMQQNAVAVILSGSGSDGSRGARRVEERGGSVLVQDPRTAEGTWMPTSAIAATRAARVLDLAGIADALLKIALARAPKP
jgi:two-component system, chemotaxis family, protein-glutamate methylesterase/glutaminase